MKPQLIDVNFSGTKTIQIKKIDQFYLEAPFHFHHLCELVWVQQSFGKRIVGDHVGNFEDGDLVLMAPNLPHTRQKISEILSNISDAEGFKKIIYFLQVIEILAGSKEFEHLASVSFKNLFDEKDTGRINKVYKFLMQNFQRDISLEEISDICH